MNHDCINKINILNWVHTLAFSMFFKTRIETRYFEPIRLLQKHGENKGEGFAIVALQCSLIEFLASTRTGKNFKLCKNREKDCGDYEYCKSKEVFIEFLEDKHLFSTLFSDDDGTKAKDFYENVRCPLLHEARTKGNWKIIANCPNNDNKIIWVDEKTGEKILYRNNLQKAFETYIDEYGKKLTKCKCLQAAFIRKFDNLCKE